MKNTTIKTLSIGLLGLVSISAFAQKTEKYFTDPVKLPSAINTGAHEESYPLLSADGKTLYFVRTYTKAEGEHPSGEQNIQVSNWENGNWSLASGDLPNLNNDHTNAVVGVSKDGQRLYVLNQYFKNVNKTAKGISFSKKEANGWAMPTTVNVPPVEFVGEHYGANISRDERVIIFSANIKDRGMGHEDLYISMVDEDGNWSAPKHLGYNINTPSPDFAPFLSHDKKKLYFSSFGHDSKGSSDIYVCERLDDTFLRWSAPKNLGAPVNTEYFDGYFTINEKDEALFSSNRDKGEYSDIYSTKIATRTIEEEPTPEEEAKLAIDELKKRMELKLVYFDVDKAVIRANDALILNAVYDLLKEYPMVGLKVMGHTDSDASEAYNMKLSERRANAAADYLVAKGIKRERLKVEFYGESKPVASNATKDGKLLNRRVDLDLYILE